jgi:hypothetical protein
MRSNQQFQIGAVLNDVPQLNFERASGQIRVEFGCFTTRLNWPREKTFCCHSEARFSLKNLSLNWT